MDDQTIVVSDALEASGEAEDEGLGDAAQPPDRE
jgi:hypothetical protein